jgi:hypothetical protein
MKNFKYKLIFVFIILLVILKIDSNLYYYGLGNGYISEKIPFNFKPYFRGSDLGFKEFAITDGSIANIDIIGKNSQFSIDNKIIIVKNVKKYSFKNDTIIVETLDLNSKKQNILISSNSKKNDINRTYKFELLSSYNFPKNMVQINVENCFTKNFIFIKAKFWLSIIMFLLLFILSLELINFKFFKKQIISKNT